MVRILCASFVIIIVLLYHLDGNGPFEMVAVFEIKIWRYLVTGGGHCPRAACRPLDPGVILHRQRTPLWSQFSCWQIICIGIVLVCAGCFFSTVRSRSTFLVFRRNKQAKKCLSFHGNTSYPAPGSKERPSFLERGEVPS